MNTTEEVIKVWIVSRLLTEEEQVLECRVTGTVAVSSHTETMGCVENVLRVIERHIS